MSKPFGLDIYNLCKALLQDSVNYQRSLVYNKFKEGFIWCMITGTFWNQKTFEYYLAVGSVYYQMYIKDEKHYKQVILQRLPP